MTKPLSLLIIATFLLVTCCNFTSATQECLQRMQSLSSNQAVCVTESYQCRNLCSGQLITSQQDCNNTPYCCYIGGKCLLKTAKGQQKPLNSDQVSNLFLEKLNKTVNEKLTIDSINGKPVLTVGKLPASGRFLALGVDDPFQSNNYEDLFNTFNGLGLEDLNEIDTTGVELTGTDFTTGVDFTGVESLNGITTQTDDSDCKKSFPDSCVIEYQGAANLNPKINIPYCQRIACDPTNAGLNYDMEQCLLTPGCSFDEDLFLYRTFAGDSILPGVPVCHLAVRNKVFQQHAIAYMQENLEWSPLLTECLIDEYKDDILTESAGCHMIDVLQHFGGNPKLAGWKGISQRDCYLIGGCWRSEQCVYPMEPGKPIKVDSANEVKKIVPTPADQFGQPACQKFDESSVNGNFLDSFHQCLAAGCATDVTRETLLKHFHGVTSTYLPQPMQYQFWSLVMLGRVRPDNWKQVADDLKKVEKTSPVDLLQNAQLHYVGSFKTPQVRTNQVSGRMLGLNNNNQIGFGGGVDETNPFGGSIDLGGGEDPLQNFLNLLPENGGGDFGGSELPDHFSQGVVIPSGTSSTDPEVTEFAVNPFTTQNKLPSGAPLGNNVLLGAEGLQAGGHNSKHPIYNDPFLKVNLGNAGLINLGATGQIRPAGGVGDLKQYLPNVLYNVLPQESCPFNVVQWEGMPALSGSVEGCCQQPLCYLPRESLAFATSGVASYLGAWTQWSQCTRTCGTGTQKRVRNCVGDEDCGSSEEESRECNFQACPQWEQWGSLSGCTKSCGGGVMTRSRLCNVVSGGCAGDSQEQHPCNTGACPVLSEWGEWSQCSVDCGRGKKVRRRQCLSQGGYGCPADQTQSMECRVYCGHVTLEDTVCDVTTCIQYPRCVQSDGTPGFCREEVIRANSKPCYAGRCLCRVFPSATGCF